MSRVNAPHPWYQSVLVIGMTLGVLLVLLSSYIYQDRQARERSHIERELQVINQLQRQSVQGWYESLLADASMLTDDAVLGDGLATLQQADNSAQQEAGQELQDRLRYLLEHANYSTIRLTDIKGQFLMDPSGPLQGRLPNIDRDVMRHAFTHAAPRVVPPRVDDTFNF